MGPRLVESDRPDLAVFTPEAGGGDDYRVVLAHSIGGCPLPSPAPVVTGMTDDKRVSRVAAVFADRTAARPPRSLCQASVEALNVSSAGLTLMSSHHSSPVCASDARAGKLDELQFALGEGPCPDAYQGRVPIFEPDLGGALSGRWPHFTPPAIESGTRGVFAFPLHSGENCIGVLTLYQDTVGNLTPDQAADGLVVADALVRSMLTIQSAGAPDVLARELTDADAHRAEVHQATGMLAVQLGIAVADAAVRLRALAYAVDRSVAAVARDIVERRLRMEENADGRGPGGVHSG